jgi:hypothetical protein
MIALQILDYRLVRLKLSHQQVFVKLVNLCARHAPGHDTVELSRYHGTEQEKENAKENPQKHVVFR